jgi:hypothetical protein
MGALSSGVAGVPLGCRDVLGIDDRAIATCTERLGQGACADCGLASCCAELEACNAEPACAAHASCFGACAAADAACQAACETEHGTDAAFAAVRTCLATHCAGQCGPACGGVQLLPPNVCDDACGGSCCAAADAAAGELDFGLLLACQRACGTADPTCVGWCENTHAAGADLARGIDECMVETCGDVARWRCVGPAQPQVSSVTSISYDWELRDLITGDPLVGLTIRACELLDLGCAQPLTAPVVTDAAGKAIVEDIPINSLTRVFDGFFEVEGDGYHFLYIEARPWIHDSGIIYNLPSDEILAAGAQAAGVELLPDRGIALINAFDCLNRNAPGVSIEFEPRDASSLPFYVDGVVPDLSLPATVDSGRAGVVNALPGYLTIHARVPTICSDVAVTRVPVRAGWFTGSTLRALAGI